MQFLIYDNGVNSRFNRGKKTNKNYTPLKSDKELKPIANKPPAPRINSVLLVCSGQQLFCLS